MQPSIITPKPCSTGRFLVRNDSASLPSHTNRSHAQIDVEQQHIMPSPQKLYLVPCLVKGRACRLFPLACVSRVFLRGGGWSR